MVRQHIEGAIDVEYEIEAAEQGLLGVYFGEPASGEAIERKCRNANSVLAHMYGPAARCKPKMTIWR